MKPHTPQGPPRLLLTRLTQCSLLCTRSLPRRQDIVEYYLCISNILLSPANNMVLLSPEEQLSPVTLLLFPVTLLLSPGARLFLPVAMLLLSPGARLFLPS